MKESEINGFHDSVECIRKVNQEKTLLIVNEHLGYTGWNPNPEEGTARTKQLFPDAEIIMVLRYQVDWILSLYRHTMDTMGCDSMEKFIAFKDDDFDINKRMLNVNSLNWVECIEAFTTRYGIKNTNILFFEDFVKDSIGFTKKLWYLIGAGDKLPYIDFYKKTNRGRSAFTCKLIEVRCYFYSIFGIQQREGKVWNQMISDGIIKRRSMLGKIYLALLYAPFRLYMAYLDRIYYIDWDMLRSMRSNLNQIFIKKNKELTKYVPRNKIPHKYFSGSG